MSAPPVAFSYRRSTLITPRSPSPATHAASQPGDVARQASTAKEGRFPVVVGVNFDDAAAYCAFVGRRLPTEQVGKKPHGASMPGPSLGQ